MPWFRVDDKLGEHPKVRAIARSRRRNAMGLWLLAGAWCALNLRDGHVPPFMLEEFCSKPSDADQLVRSGLWHATGHECPDCAQPRDERGYIFHDWATLQFTHAQAMEKREQDRQRQHEYRERKRLERLAQSNQSRTSHNVTDAESQGRHATVHLSRPDPTRPDPTVVPNGTTKEPVPRKRGERLPEDWQPDPSLIAWQRAEGIPDSLARRELSVFRDYWAAKPGREGVKADWPATWRNWLRRAAESVASRPVSVGSAALVPAIRTWTPPEDAS